MTTVTVTVRAMSLVACADCGSHAVKCAYVPGGSVHVCLDCGRTDCYTDIHPAATRAKE